MDQPRHGECPFKEGDRIDHQLFGFGTVVGIPTPMVGASVSGIMPRGWAVQIDWDDPAKLTSRAMSEGLTKAPLPHVRPFAYWDRKWQPLLQAWRLRRKAVENYSSTFRPVPDAQRLEELRREEAEAWQAM